MTPGTIAEESLPGTIWNNHGRWWWKVKLPGDPARRNIPLKASWSQVATVDRTQALKVAASIYRDALLKAQGVKPPRIREAMYLSELRRLWLEAQGMPDDAELSTRILLIIGHRPIDTVKAADPLVRHFSPADRLRLGLHS